MLTNKRAYKVKNNINNVGKAANPMEYRRLEREPQAIALYVKTNPGFEDGVAFGGGPAPPWLNTLLGQVSARAKLPAASRLKAIALE